MTSSLTSNDKERTNSFPSQSSQQTAQSRSDPQTHPMSEKEALDGGTIAWLQVLGSFFCLFSSWGVINSFGVYQAYYESYMLSSSTPSDISWIGSIQAFCLIFFSSVAGPIYDAGHFRLMIGVGSFLVVFGHMMLSISSNFWQVILSQGLCIGLGTTLLFLPSVAILGTYFKSRLALATGLAATGSSIGGVIYTILLAKMLPTIGFAWSNRVLGFVALATLLIPNMTMKLRTPPATMRRIIDFAAWKEGPYALYVVGSTIGYIGFFAIFVYVGSYAVTEHIMDEGLTFYLLSILNAGSVFGRIIPNWIADHVGPFNVLGPAYFLTGALGFCLIVSRSAASLIAVCALIGFTSGALMSLSPAVYISISQHSRGMIGTRMGMGYMMNGIGILLAGPVSGWVLGGSNFAFVWVLVGLLCVASSLFIMAARASKTRSFAFNVKA